MNGTFLLASWIRVSFWGLLLAVPLVVGWSNDGPLAPRTIKLQYVGPTNWAQVGRIYTTATRYGLTKKNPGMVFTPVHLVNTNNGGYTGYSPDPDTNYPYQIQTTFNYGQGPYASISNSFGFSAASFVRQMVILHPAPTYWFMTNWLDGYYTAVNMRLTRNLFFGDGKTALPIFSPQLIAHDGVTNFFYTIGRTNSYYYVPAAYYIDPNDRAGGPTEWGYLAVNFTVYITNGISDISALRLTAIDDWLDARTTVATHSYRTNVLYLENLADLFFGEAINQICETGKTPRAFGTMCAVKLVSSNSVFGEP